MRQLFATFAAFFSINASANVFYTRVYCVQQTNPAKDGSIFTFINEANGFIYANTGGFETHNGGLGPNDDILCPYSRIMKGAEPVEKSGYVFAYKAGEYSLTFDTPVGPTTKTVKAKFTSTQLGYETQDLPMNCTVAEDFPYVCVPHPYVGE